MMNKQLAFVKSGLGLALCFLLVGAGNTPPLYAANTEVSVNQQARTVTGTVKDAKGETLLGVNVVVKGTTNGTITDLDGKYSLEVPSNAILEFSYIGYVTQAVPVTGRVMDIVMKEDARNLDEVVVVGYGTQAKKDITGSVAVVDTKDLLASSGSSATQQLQGKAAGVYIGQNGSPGASTMVRIRGINTVNDNGPLYVIDGVSTRNQNLSSLNPNDIESMQVLKDASAAAIYGAQAANGVILITTKKGKKGKVEVTLDSKFGVNTRAVKEYDIITDMIREENPIITQKRAIDLYTKDDFLSEVYMSSENYDTLSELLKVKKNVILQGAPGTGKTYNTAAIALSVLGIDGVDLDNHDEVMKKYEELQDDRIFFTTFHQSLDYEDFVEGLKPRV